MSIQPLMKKRNNSQLYIHTCDLNHGKIQVYQAELERILINYPELYRFKERNFPHQCVTSNLEIFLFLLA